MKYHLEFKATIRLWRQDTSAASWHFLTLPPEINEKIKDVQQYQEKTRGWGAVKVEVRIGYYTRKTSVFPSKDIGSYILPIKKEVRTELHIGVGDDVYVFLHLL